MIRTLPATAFKILIKALAVKPEDAQWFADERNASQR